MSVAASKSVWRGLAAAIVILSLGVLSSLAASQVASGAQPPDELKDGFGHYVRTMPPDSGNLQERLGRAVEVCSNDAVSGVVWVENWRDLEPTEGSYTFGRIDDALDAISTTDAGRDTPCKLMLRPRWNTFFQNGLNPCPQFLINQGHSSENPHDGFICHMWEANVRQAYVDLIEALGAEFDSMAQFQGIAFPETAGGDHADPEPFAMQASFEAFYQACSDSFPTSWCIAYMNYVAAAEPWMGLMEGLAGVVRKLPNVCVGGNDSKPDTPGLYVHEQSIYRWAVMHPGCRTARIDKFSYYTPGPTDAFPGYQVTPDTICLGTFPNGEPGCSLEDMFRFTVRGTFGQPELFGEPGNPRAYETGQCANAFIEWGYRKPEADPWPSGHHFSHALEVIEAHPYGRDWTDRCEGGGPPLTYPEELSNPGFEDGLASWTRLGDPSVGVATAPNNVHTGDQAVWVSGRQNTYDTVQQDVTSILEANGPGEYDLSALVRLASGSDDAKVVLRLVDGSPDPKFSVVSTEVANTGWTKISGTQDVSWDGNLQSASIRVPTASETVGMYIDDVSLVKVGGLLQNPGFEGGVAPWIKLGDPSVGVATAPNNVHTGDQAVWVSGRQNTYDTVRQDVTSVLRANGPGEYDLSAWVRLASGTDDAKVTLAVTDSTSPQTESYFVVSTEVTSTGWRMISGTQEVSWDGNLQSAYIQVPTASETVGMYIDDVSLVKLD